MTILLPTVANQYLRTSRAAGALVPVGVQLASKVGVLVIASGRLPSEPPGVLPPAAPSRAFSSSANFQPSRNLPSRYQLGFDAHKEVKREMRTRGKDNMRASSLRPSPMQVSQAVDQELKRFMSEEEPSAVSQRLNDATVKFAVRDLIAAVAPSDPAIFDRRIIPSLYYVDGKWVAVLYGIWFSPDNAKLKVKFIHYQDLNRTAAGNTRSSALAQGGVIRFVVYESYRCAAVLTAIADWNRFKERSISRWDNPEVVPTKVDTVVHSIECGIATNIARLEADRVLPMSERRAPPSDGYGTGGGGGGVPPSGSSPPPSAPSAPALRLPLGPFPSTPGRTGQDIIISL